jgi:predicted SAM-dependent methyltransferase
MRGWAANRRNYTVARLETLSAWQRLQAALSPAQRKRIAELRNARGLSINVGAGGRGHPGWLNMDAVPGENDTLALDLRRGLPLADCSVQRAFAEHVIEHLHFRDEAPFVLGELLRVLEPGGVARIIVPDLELYTQAYVSRDPERFRELGWDLERMPDDIFTPMHILNHVFQQDGEHLFGYDFETLAWLLRRVGFADVQRMRYGESLDPQLAIDRLEHAKYSLYVDARKG